MGQSQRALRSKIVDGRRRGPGDEARIRALKMRPAGSKIDAVPPSQEAVRAAIDAGKCPFCGSGPWKMLPVHTNKIHGVDKWQLRDLAGLTTSGSLCSPESLAKMAGSNRRTPEEMSALSLKSRNKRTVESRRWTQAGTDQRGSQLRNWQTENPKIMAELRREFRSRMTTPEAREKHVASMARVAAERHVSMEERVAFRERMAAPDVVAKREAKREATRVTGCSVVGCERPHAARGLCQYHWRRWDVERKRKPRRETCVQCEQPMDAQRPTRKYCSNACSLRAQRIARNAKHASP